MIIDFDADRKRQARDRRKRQNAKRLRDWQGARSDDFAVLRKYLERERALAALRSFFGPTRTPPPILLFRPKFAGDLWRGWRTQQMLPQRQAA